MEINVSPVLFHLGGLEIRWYGAMMALGVTVLITWSYYQIKRGANLSVDNLTTGAMIGIPSAIVFARLLHVLDGPANIEYYFSVPSRIIGGAGLTIYGAVLGAALGVWIYSRFSKLNFSYVADVVTPGIILAQALGRVGCLFNGCCYGKEIAGSPLNIIYTNPESFAPLNEAFQPTQAYEILFLLALFAVIMVFRSKLKPSGVQFMFYLGMYSLWRIGIGFLRVGTPFAFGLEQAQVIGIVVAVVCFGGILILRRKMNREKIISTQESGNQEKSA